MNKRIFFITTLLVLATLVLAACSSQSDSATQAGTSEAAPQNANADSARGDDGQGSLSTQMMLAAGTLKLEDTDLAVTADQATELLPLWKAAKSLVDSDNITSEEINAIYDQIEETMTADQMAAIADMNLSFADLRDVFPDMQMGMGAGQFGDVDREAMQATREAMGDDFQPPEGFQGGGGGGPDGGFPGGGPDGGFPGGNAGNNSDSGERVSPTTTIYDPVIELLESKLE